MATALITVADHPTGLGTARGLEVDVRLIGLCTNAASRFCGDAGVHFWLACVDRSARKLVMAAANFIGLGSLEVKKSETDDQHYITEPTVGRNNMRSYIAVAAA